MLDEDKLSISTMLALPMKPEGPQPGNKDIHSVI